LVPDRAPYRHSREAIGGTAIYSTSDGDDLKVYAVVVGPLRQRNELVPRRQAFVRSQQAWVNNISSIPKFDTMPPP
jgi:hypothetical protein